MKNSRYPGGVDRMLKHLKKALDTQQHRHVGGQPKTKNRFGRYGKWFRTK